MSSPFGLVGADSVWPVSQWFQKCFKNALKVGLAHAQKSAIPAQSSGLIVLTISKYMEENLKLCTVGK